MDAKHAVLFLRVVDYSLFVLIFSFVVVFSAGMHPPGPPLARPILPKDRGAVDRVIEYLVGDGPQNR